MWNKNGGHYNIRSKSFDSLSNLRAVMAFDLKYGIQSSKNIRNIDISQNRFTYYCHSIYIPPIHRSKMKRIFQGIMSYRLDSLYDHPLNSLQMHITQSLMSVDDYLRKNVNSLKYSQFSNPNNMHNKKHIIETLMTRALDKEEDIDSPKAIAEVILSLCNQIYLLRIAEPSTKFRMYQDLSNIIAKDFQLDHNDVKNQGMATRDAFNLKKVVNEY